MDRTACDHTWKQCRTVCPLTKLGANTDSCVARCNHLHSDCMKARGGAGHRHWQAEPFSDTQDDVSSWYDTPSYEPHVY